MSKGGRKQYSCLQVLITFFVSYLFQAFVSLFRCFVCSFHCFFFLRFNFCSFQLSFFSICSFQLSFVSFFVRFNCTSFHFGSSFVSAFPSSVNFRLSFVPLNYIHLFILTFCFFSAYRSQLFVRLTISHFLVPPFITYTFITYFMCQL